MLSATSQRRPLGGVVTLMRQRQRLDTVAPRGKLENGSIMRLRVFAEAQSRDKFGIMAHHDGPAEMSECPTMYLVTEWTTLSMP